MSERQPDPQTCEHGRIHADPYAVIPPPDDADQITEWIYQVIGGPAGMNSYEVHEMAVWPQPDDRIAAAEWTIRCLAQNREGSTVDVLRRILQRRCELGLEMPDE